jgi:hypothetical protein
MDIERGDQPSKKETNEEYNLILVDSKDEEEISLDMI